MITVTLSLESMSSGIGLRLKMKICLIFQLAIACFTTSAPTNPVAPVMMIFMVDTLDIGERVWVM